jgi:hypothetical protein
LVIQNADEQEKIFRTLMDKYNRIDIKKAGEQFILYHRYEKLAEYFKAECLKLAEMVESYSVQLDITTLISQANDLITMVNDYTMNVENNELLKQVASEQKAIVYKLNELALTQGLKITKSARVVRPYQKVDEP